jgi:hypothetical protein
MVVSQEGRMAKRMAVPKAVRDELLCGGHTWWDRCGGGYQRNGNDLQGRPDGR